MTHDNFDATVLKSNDISKLFVGDFVGTKVNSEQLEVLRKDDINGMLRTGFLYIVILILNLICSYAQTWILQLTGQNIIYKMRNELFHHIHSLP